MLTAVSSYKNGHRNGHKKVVFSLREVEPPSDHPAEMCVVASLYMYPEEVLPLIEKWNLKKEHFYYPETSELYETFFILKDIYGIDGITEFTVRRYLEQAGREDLFNNLQYMIDNRHDARGQIVESAIVIVKEKAIIRNMLSKTVEILHTIKEKEDIHKLKELYENALEEIKETKVENIEPEEWLYELAFEYSEEDIEVKWIVPDIVPEGSLTLITAQAGVGKTYLMYSWMKNYIIPQGYKVIYLDMDNSRIVINKRLRESGLYEKTKPHKDPQLLIISREDKRIFIGSDAWTRFKEAMRLLAERGDKRVIIVDSLKNISRTMDLNTDKDTEEVMSELKDLMSMGHTVIVVHHVPKLLNPSLPFKNSGTILDNVEIAYHMTRDEERNITTLKCFKNRFGDKKTIHISIDKDMNIHDALDPELQKEVEIAKVVLNTIGLGGKSKTQIEEEAAKRLGIGVKQVRQFLEKYMDILWTEESADEGRGRPKKIYYPIQGVDLVKTITENTRRTSYTEGGSLKPASEDFSAPLPKNRGFKPASDNFSANFQNPIYIDCRKIKKSEEEVWKEIGEEILRECGEINLEVFRTEDINELFSYIEDKNIRIGLLRLWMAIKGKDNEELLKKYERGEIELADVYEQISGEEDEFLDF